MAARSEILVSLLVELDRFDEKLGVLVRANRERIALTEAFVGDIFEQFATGSPSRRRNGTFMPSPSRRS